MKSRLIKSCLVASNRFTLSAVAMLLTIAVPGIPAKVLASGNAFTQPSTALGNSVNNRVLLAQASGFEYEDFDFWAAQCLLFSAETDDKKALETCEKAISLRPRDLNLELWFARSQALFRMGEYVEAFGSFEQVVVEAPKDSISVAYQCASLYHLSRLEDAVDTCESALQIDGNWGTESPALAWYYRGLALQAMGRLETALSSYERALIATPEDGAVRAELCAIATELGQYTRCPLTEAVTVYDRLLAADPENATLWFQQGLVLEQLGRFAQAADSYASAIAITPDDSLTLAHHCAALNEIEAYEEALAACDAALAGNGHWNRLGPAFGWSQRSAAQIGLGEYDLALASANRAIAIDNTYPGGWNNQAVSLWYSGHLCEAITAIETAQTAENIILDELTNTFDQTYTEPLILFHRRRAVTAYNQGSILLDLYLKSPRDCAFQRTLLSEAEQAFERVRSLNHIGQTMLTGAVSSSRSWPETLTEGTFLDNGFLSSLFTNYSVVALSQEDDPDIALDYTATARRYNSNSFEAWLNSGLAYAADSDYEKARAAYERAATIDPERLDATMIGPILARAALTRGDASGYLAAWNLYTAAALADPAAVDAVVGQGLSLQGLSSCNTEAIRVFERAINMDPTNQVARQQHAQLIQETPPSDESDTAPSNCPIVLQ